MNFVHDTPGWMSRWNRFATTRKSELTGGWSYKIKCLNKETRWTPSSRFLKVYRHCSLRSKKMHHSNETFITFIIMFMTQTHENSWNLYIYSDKNFFPQLHPLVHSEGLFINCGLVYSSKNFVCCKKLMSSCTSTSEYFPMHFSKWENWIFYWRPSWF